MHDEAVTNHDLKGVIACLTEKLAIIGIGPGEIWVGQTKSKWPPSTSSKASTKESEKIEYQFKIGGVTADMGWLMASAM